MENQINAHDWKKLLDFVYHNTHSSLYREKFTEANFNPDTDFETLDDVTKVPLLAKAELVKADAAQLVFVPENKVTGVSVTSGTTGTPLVTFRSPSETPAHPSGLADPGRALILFGAISGSAMLHFFRERGEMAFVGDIYNLSNTVAIAAKAEIRNILTTPTIAIALRAHLHTNPALFATLKYIRLAGELLTLEKRNYLQSLYPHQGIYGLYGLNEIGGVTHQCERLTTRTDGIFFHLDLAQTFFEIIHPDTLLPVASGEMGEVVVTDFTSLGTPFIRYRTGDLGRLVASDCPCGTPGQLLAVAGRADTQSVKAGGFMFTTVMFEPTIDALQEIISPHFAITVREIFSDVGVSVALTLAVMPQRGLTGTSESKELIAQTIAAKTRLSSMRTLAEAIAEGLCEPVHVTYTTFLDVAHKRKATITLETHES